MLSCTKIRSRTDKDRRCGRTCCLRFCLAILALALPCSGIREPRQTAEVSPYTITLPPPYSTTLYTHSRYNFSPLHRTCISPSEPITWNFDSSLKGTCDHCSFVQTTCSWAKAKQALWFFLGIKGFFAEGWASNLESRNLREIVFRYTLTSEVNLNLRNISTTLLNQIMIRSCLKALRGLSGLGLASSILIHYNTSRPSYSSYCHRICFPSLWRHTIFSFSWQDIGRFTLAALLTVECATLTVECSNTLRTSLRVF